MGRSFLQTQVRWGVGPSILIGMRLQMTEPLGTVLYQVCLVDIAYATYLFSHAQAYRSTYTQYMYLAWARAELGLTLGHGSYTMVHARTLTYVYACVSYRRCKIFCMCRIPQIRWISG